MANLGTLAVRVSTIQGIPLSVQYSTSVAFTPSARKFVYRRPVAWWRGYSNGDPTSLLQYPDNGRFGGLTEKALLMDPYVKVALIYYPTMTIIGFGISDAVGHLNLGYLDPAAPLALDKTDSSSYALIAFDPSRNFNLVGFDQLTPVT
jgi:hypothetical protein